MKNLESNWLATVLSGLVFLPNLISIRHSGFGFINGFLTLFLGLLFVQSIRGIIRLRGLRAKILKNPDSVRMNHVNEAPNIKSLFWFS